MIYLHKYLKNSLFAFIFIFLLQSNLGLASDKLLSISLGPVQLGETRIPIALENFHIRVKKIKNTKVSAHLIKDSIQWVRGKDNLLIPRALMEIKIYNKEPKVHISYLGATIIPTWGENFLSTSIYVNLFNPEHVLIKESQKNIALINITTSQDKKVTKSKVIDYSCSPYSISIEGLDDEYLSMGCRMERRGELGAERPRLEINWTATNFKLLDGKAPPYTTFLHDSRPVKLTVIDLDKKPKVITITAKLPKRLKRLKTALGLGPYSLKTQTFNRELPDRWAPSVMLYGKLDFTPTTSLRFFDAAIISKSKFNNGGLYFAYEMADAFDGRLSFIPLLGAQALSFRFDSTGVH